MKTASLLTLALCGIASSSAKPLTRPFDHVGLEARQAGIPQNATGSPSPAFPTNVGYPGTIRLPLQAPFLAETDRVNSTAPRDGKPYEDRYTPAQANSIDGTNSTSNNDTSSSSGSNSTNSTASSTSTFEIVKSWGNTSPYFPSPLFPEAQVHRQLDPSCSIEQVHILHRHGSRFPTSYSTEGAPFFGQTVANATRDAANGGAAFNNSGPLAFLSNWTYKLGAEILTPLGAQELFDSGVFHYFQYGRLYNATTQPHKPVIRTTSEERMLDSAKYWTAGFFGLDAPNLVDLEVIIEADGFNNTLASYDTCTGANDYSIGDEYLTPVWEKIYLNKTVKRLQQYTSLNLTTELVYGMQSLCAYETVAFGYSPFCELFTEEEWKGFEYFLDLQFSGDYGFQSPSGRAQGIGYAQDLLARLSNTTIPASNITTQNSSLLTSQYFPLDQPFYVDFTHDDIILSGEQKLCFNSVPQTSTLTLFPSISAHRAELHASGRRVALGDVHERQPHAGSLAHHPLRRPPGLRGGHLQQRHEDHPHNPQRRPRPDDCRSGLHHRARGRQLPVRRVHRLPELDGVRGCQL